MTNQLLPPEQQQHIFEVRSTPDSTSTSNNKNNNSNRTLSDTLLTVFPNGNDSFIVYKSTSTSNNSKVFVKQDALEQSNNNNTTTTTTNATTPTNDSQQTKNVTIKIVDDTEHLLQVNSIDCGNINKLTLLREEQSNSSTKTNSTATAIKHDILLNDKTIMEFLNSNFNNSTTTIEFSNLTIKSNESIILFHDNLNLMFKNCKFNGICLQFYGKCKIQIENCEFLNSHVSGIEILDESIATIQSSKFTKNNTGLRISKKGNVQIDNCIFIENQGSAIITQDDSQLNLNKSELKLNEGFGVLTYQQSSVTIIGNVIKGNERCGLCLTNTDKYSLIKDNQIVNNSENGISISGISTLGSKFEILNNLIKLNKLNGIHILDGVGIPLSIDNNEFTANGQLAIRDDTINFSTAISKTDTNTKPELLLMKMDRENELMDWIKKHSPVINSLDGNQVGKSSVIGSAIKNGSNCLLN